MCKYNSLQQCCILTIFPIILMIGCGILGIVAINDSKNSYPLVSCEIADIVAFDCDYDSWENKYHTATAMILLINNTNYTTIMFNNCNSCFTCKNIYNVTNIYNCTLADGIYKIYDYNHIKYEHKRSVIFGAIFLTISGITAVILVGIVLSSCRHIIKHLPYTKL